MVTRDQALDVLDAVANDLDDYKRRCFLGPLAGGPIFRSDFKECSQSAMIDAVERFLDVDAPKAMLAGKYEGVVRAAAAISSLTRSEYERLGSEQSASALAERFLAEVIEPTVTTAVKGGIGAAGLALVAYALWRLTR